MSHFPNPPKSTLVVPQNLSAKRQVSFNEPYSGCSEAGREAVQTPQFSRSQCARYQLRLHDFRHTTTTHPMRSGIDINTIRAWLGHVSIDTTNNYAEVDLRRKAENLVHFDPFSTTPITDKRWKNERFLLVFLRSL